MLWPKVLRCVGVKGVCYCRQCDKVMCVVGFQPQHDGNATGSRGACSGAPVFLLFGNHGVPKTQDCILLAMKHVGQRPALSICRSGDVRLVLLAEWGLVERWVQIGCWRGFPRHLGYHVEASNVCSVLRALSGLLLSCSVCWGAVFVRIII